MALSSVDFSFDYIMKGREYVLHLMNSLTTEQMNKIPKGYNNNIIWNVVHITVVPQDLCYKLANVPTPIPESLISKYTIDTKPEGDVSSEDIETYKKLLIDSTLQLKKDYEDGIFKTYNPLTTEVGVTLDCIENAIQAIAIHDHLHIGFMNAQKKEL